MQTAGIPCVTPTLTAQPRFFSLDNLVCQYTVAYHNNNYVYCNNAPSLKYLLVSFSTLGWAPPPSALKYLLIFFFTLKRPHPSPAHLPLEYINLLLLSVSYSLSRQWALLLGSIHDCSCPITWTRSLTQCGYSKSQHKLPWPAFSPRYNQIKVYNKGGGVKEGQTGGGVALLGLSCYFWGTYELTVCIWALSIFQDQLVIFPRGLKAGDNCPVPAWLQT